ncbi:MAG: lipopolysaccharide biosynthesis protein [Pseudomonadota bacterium]|nr:lipopolysaccharide biosynthesis protein [Pseudomonadota bacterium]
MRAEIATPEIVTLAPPARSEPSLRADGEVETALIGRILWRRRKWIAAATGLALLTTLGYSLLATPQYTAVAQILVDPRDKQVVGNDVNPSAIAADGGLTQVESQGSVLQSSGVLLRAIAATHLENDSEFNGSGLLGAISRVFSALGKAPDAAAESERLKARTLQTLRRHMTVKRADKVLVLDLSVSAKTPAKASEIANAIADAYLADQADARSDAGRDASKALAGRLGELHANLKDAENAVADYRAANGFVVSSGQLVSDQEINQTTALLSAAQNRAASLKAQLDQLRRDPGAQGTPEAMASGAMVRLRDRESAIVEKVASASKQLGPLHPEIASLEQSLREVRGLIAKETQRLRQAAEADYARAKDDETALSKKLAGMKVKSLDDDKADVHLRELQRQADAARSIYQAFLLRAKETMEASNVDTTNARVITRALPPLQKSWPPTLLLLLGAGFLGMSLGASASLAHEYIRPTLLTPRQARDLAGAPVLGIIAGRDLAAGVKPARSSADVVARKLLRALSDGEAGGGPVIGRCLYLTSAPAAAAERARLAERIAALAGAGKREILLIDGDLRDDAGSDRAGLTELLRGEQSIADLAYREPGERFVRLANGGQDPVDWSARAGTDAFRLRRVRRCYDLVVIDGGAMSDNHRLAPLAAQADFVLLVAAIGQQQAEIAGEIDAAAAAGADFDGVALVDRGEPA